MKSLCVGRSTYHFNLKTNDFASVGMNLETNEVLESSSGSGVNAARVLGKYGVETYLASSIGDDTFGNLIRKDLEKLGVHTEYMETAFDKRTTLSFSVSKKETNEKLSYTANKEKLVLKKTDFPMEPDVVYVDGYDYGASLAALNKYSSKITIINAKGPSQELVELCKYCKYIIATKEFAEWVSGKQIDFNSSDTLVAVYSSLLNRFVGKQIIITLGEKGSLYITNNQIRIMPPLNVELVDNVGAGDIFGGAFAYALLQGYDLEKAVTFANIAGGLSITKPTPKDSVADLSDVMTYFNQKYGVPAPAPQVPANEPETL